VRMLDIAAPFPEELLANAGNSRRQRQPAL